MTSAFNVELLGLTPAVNNLIKAAETLTSAAQEVSKEDQSRASLSERCAANIQAYLDAMLPASVKYPNSNISIGSDRDKWDAAQVETLALRKELGTAGAEAFDKHRHDAIMTRRKEIG